MQSWWNLRIHRNWGEPKRVWCGGCAASICQTKLLKEDSMGIDCIYRMLWDEVDLCGLDMLSENEWIRKCMDLKVDDSAGMAKCGNGNSGLIVWMMSLKRWVWEEKWHKIIFIGMYVTTHITINELKNEDLISEKYCMKCEPMVWNKYSFKGLGLTYEHSSMVVLSLCMIMKITMGISFLILIIIRLNKKSAGMRNQLDWVPCCLLQQLSSKQLGEVAVQHDLYSISLLRLLQILYRKLAAVTSLK